MLWTLVEKEIRNNLLNTRFAVAFFAVSVLVVGSAAFVLADYITARNECLAAAGWERAFVSRGAHDAGNGSRRSD